MIFEKINNYQIKCVIEKEDFISRNINIADLFYGSPKTEQLFDEILSIAQNKYEFNTKKLPVSIDAVPLPDNTLVLIIAIVEDPEEIDTRFSRFTPSSNTRQDNFFSNNGTTHIASDDVLKLFDDDFISDTPKALSPYANMYNPRENDFSTFDNSIRKNPDGTMLIIFKFENIDKVIELSKLLVNIYHDKNSLYQAKNCCYLFVYNNHAYTESDFSSICDLICEYGNPVTLSQTTIEHILEHSELIIADSAIYELSEI